MSQENLLLHFCEALNAVKRTAFSQDSIACDAYLGGDLGIDSIEMLEIWFRIEKNTGTKIPDNDKRDIYTVAAVLSTIERHLTVSA